MTNFYNYWAALFAPSLIGWTICAQFLAAITIVAVHFVVWRARYHALICVPLGALGLLALSVPLFVTGWLFGGWGDLVDPPPPDFVDLTWIYFAGLETGFILLALGTALLHRKQFALPLLRGFCGFFCDAFCNFLIFTLVIQISTKFTTQLGRPFEDKIVLFYVLNGFVLWPLFTWMRPTMLGALRCIGLARHPKA